MTRMAPAMVALALTVTAVAAPAQNAPAGPPPGLPMPNVGPRDPLSLPGDVLPPPLGVVLAMPRPAASGSPPPPPPAARPVVPGPSLEVALAAAQAALSRCSADGLKVGVAVSDSLGVVKVGLQHDEASPGRIFNAARKNLTAIEFAVASSQVRERLRAGDFAALARARPNMTLFPGAVPLIKDGKPIGAIGVSGAAAEQDEACAAAGAAAVGARL